MIDFTPTQRQAIETTGRSVVVTAAAGSGKTAVLAERCAHLVCDLPPDRRCRVDELLVVTFTEAAATEMKGRILEAIRSRLRRRPADGYLRRQVALLDTAQISTLHAFCLWMLRRWFSQAGIDPTAPLLDADEARLLRAETLDNLFTELYAADSELGHGFVRLVDNYGLGRDTQLADLFLRLAEFLRSLPDPDGWIASTRQAMGASVEDTISQYRQMIATEIAAQRASAKQVADAIRQHLPAWSFYGDKARQYAETLARWQAQTDWDATCAEVAELKIGTTAAPRLSRDASAEERADRDLAKALLDSVRKDLFEKRLRPLARFTIDQMRQGLAAVAPYAETLLDLVTAFDKRYLQAKKTAGVLDFTDLERGAYDLLGDNDDPAGLSAIARDLHARFAHVLVDEFQDINPLQDAILGRVSRERDLDRADNLFCVGDAKQSIYRFRLADPELFRRRVENARGTTQPATPKPSTGATLEERGRVDSRPVCVHLQENFRSDPNLIDGINLLFERLMTRDRGGGEHDESARLRPGRPASPSTDVQPIEVHLLERSVGGDPQLDDPGESEDGPERDRRTLDATDPAAWEVIEREAYLIGRRILELRGTGLGDGESLAWGDVAILLRAAAHTAGPMVDILRRMGIPAVAPVGEALTESLEVGQVLDLLTVLDNPQQDIPLASVLRSGVTGMALNEDHLTVIRCLDREAPFHETVRRFVREAEDGDLRCKLSRLVDRLARWRRAAQRRPLADVLWTVYRESGYLARVGGLNRGLTRRANLLALHERARQFGGFQRQGLHRFLRFVESLESSGSGLAGPPPAGADQNVVNVMSIHRSKGLEFPVVFLANLDRQFNLGDARGDTIFDRRAGIGLRVVDPNRMIKYPSILHRQAARAIESAGRDEELRVLYVALTRARERLILVGSTGLTRVQQTRDLARRGSEAAPALGLDWANRPLDWLIPILASAPPGSVHWSGDGPHGLPQAPSYRVDLHTEDEMAEWRLERPATGDDRSTALAATRLAPLPDNEPQPDDAAAAAAITDRIDFLYPHLTAASVRAVVGASEAKRAVDPFMDEHQPAAPQYAPQIFESPAALAESPTGISPARRGIVTHAVLERWDLNATLEGTLSELVAGGLLTEPEAEAVDAEALNWFAGTDLGQRLRDAGTAYLREFLFIAAEPAHLFDSALRGTCDEQVLVRGIIDGVLPTDAGLELIDYKTDAIAPAAVPDRADRYRMQMNLYAKAATRIWRRPIRHRWLVFLTPRRIIELHQETDSP
ncbi:MAG: helicase-exonuclease AddAB subunit AddA [bacterium]|nr:helicase-exonuclease AddAB subunit AddA [bacterium]